MSAIDRRLDKLEETYAPPLPPGRWRRVIADSQVEADQITSAWNAATAARASEGVRENLIVRVIVSNTTMGSDNGAKIEDGNNVWH